MHFRGASSYFSVGEGFKRSLNIAIDHTDPKADLLGYRTLNLLNASGDPSLMSTVLYSHIAGSWTRASDYTLFAEAKGIFHLIPHDMNEAFSSGHGGLGGPGGRRGGGRHGGPRGGGSTSTRW